MTLEEMKAMELNDYIETDMIIRFQLIQRVPNGWNYVYAVDEGITSTFVPEIIPIQEHVEPRPKFEAQG